MDRARLTGRLSGAFTGQLDISHILGELIILDRRVRSLAASPPGVLVDSSVGVFAIT